MNVATQAWAATPYDDDFYAELYFDEDVTFGKNKCLRVNGDRVTGEIRIYEEDLPHVNNKVIEAVLAWAASFPAITATSFRIVNWAHEHRRPTKTDFQGKTILRFQADADNVWRFWFTDGSAFAIQSELGACGVPIMEVCEACASTKVSK